MSGDLSSRFAQLHARMERATRGRAPATLIAVSKTQPAAAVHAAWRLGQRDFGENYVQELVAKAQELTTLGVPQNEIRWHFIGHLQSNKINAVYPWVHAIHSIDSVKLAAKIAGKSADRRADQALDLFLEVNVDDEQTKAGFAPDTLIAALPELSAIARAHPAVRFKGLMAIPRSVADGGDPAASFGRLRDLERRCRPLTQGALSMGMSDDFELALAAGATHIRVGSALFGPRV